MIKSNLEFRISRLKVDIMRLKEAIKNHPAKSVVLHVALKKNELLMNRLEQMKIEKEKRRTQIASPAAWGNASYRATFPKQSRNT